MKGYSTLLRSPELEDCNQILLCVIPSRTSFKSIFLLKKNTYLWNSPFGHVHQTDKHNLICPVMIYFDIWWTWVNSDLWFSNFLEPGPLSVVEHFLWTLILVKIKSCESPHKQNLSKLFHKNHIPNLHWVMTFNEKNVFALPCINPQFLIIFLTKI